MVISEPVGCIPAQKNREHMQVDAHLARPTAPRWNKEDVDEAVLIRGGGEGGRRRRGEGGSRASFTGWRTI